jgi:ribosomal protein L21E
MGKVTPLSLTNELEALVDAFEPYKKLPKLGSLNDFFCKVSKAIDDRFKSTQFHGVYMTPEGPTEAHVGVDGIRSMLNAMTDVLNDTRNRRSPQKDSFDITWLLLQILDKVPMFGVKKVMNLAAIIYTTPVPVDVYTCVAFRFEIIGNGRDLTEGYDRRDGNTWWRPETLEETVRMQMRMKDDDVKEFLEHQRELGVIDHLEGGWAPKKVITALNKVAALVELDNASLNPLKLEFASNSPLSEEQKNAITSCLQYRISELLAPGGTGKTFTMSNVISQLLDKNLSVAVVAPTGVAGETLRKEITDNIGSNYISMLASGDVRTIDWWIVSPKSPDEVDVLVVDEASMMTYDHLSGLPNAGHTIFIGDIWQLPPVGTGTPLDDFRFLYPNRVFELTTNMRARNAPKLARWLTDLRDTKTLHFKEIYSTHESRAMAGRLYSMTYMKTAKTAEDVKQIHDKYSVGTHYMLDKLCVALHYNATLTCLRKDVSGLANYWMLLARKFGVTTWQQASCNPHLIAIADEIQTRSVINKTLADKVFGRHEILYPFEVGDDVVWVSAREDVFVKKGEQRLSVYSGFVGTIVGADQEEYEIEFPQVGKKPEYHVFVKRTECRVSDSPITLSKVRNVHKLQSMGVNCIMYIVSGLRTVKLPNGSWKSFIDLPEAYTAVSRARKGYFVANPYGERSIRRDSHGNILNLGERPKSWSAAYVLAARGELPADAEYSQAELVDAVANIVLED